MRHLSGRYVGRGVACTVLAAAGFAALFAITSGAFREGMASGGIQLAASEVYGLLLSSWFVIPLGLALGLLFPRLVLERSASRAVLVGSGIGLLVGVLVAGCLKMMYPLSSFSRIATLSVPYCLAVAVMVTIWFRHVVKSSAAA
jgi:hypothetical protein